MTAKLSIQKYINELEQPDLYDTCQISLLKYVVNKNTKVVGNADEKNKNAKLWEAIRNVESAKATTTEDKIERFSDCAA